MADENNPAQPVGEVTPPTPAPTTNPTGGETNYEELLKTDTSLQNFLTGRVQTATQTAVNEALEKQRILQDEKVTEAEKLAKMNKEEKQAYELKKAQEEITRYKQQESVRGLKEEAIKSASEKGVPLSLVELIPFAHIKADEVNAHLDSMKSEFDNAVKEGVASALDGAGMPRGAGAQAKAFTKEEIGKMSAEEINKNWANIKNSL